VSSPVCALCSAINVVINVLAPASSTNDAAICVTAKIRWRRLVVLLVLLGIGQKIVSNGFYLFPQGIFGIWLIVVNWRLSGSLPGWLRWFGMIVGLGLALVGTCFIGLCFVYPATLAIPAVPQESIKEVNSVANTFFHQLLFSASFMGVATLPIWTILTGFQLLKKRRLAAIA
jgi:hypothetical protein